MIATRSFQTLTLALAPAFAMAQSPVLAAHAGDPYRNVDHSNDMGNNTGDSQVEGLNATQLDQNYRGPVEMRTPAANPQTVQTPPGYAPRYSRPISRGDSSAGMCLSAAVPAMPMRLSHASNSGAGRKPSAPRR